MVRGIAIPNWLAALGAPGIMAAGKDSRFIGKAFRGFCTAHNIVLQTAIPGYRQSLGATERWRGLFRSIIDHVVGNKKPNSLSNKEWEEYAAMTMARLNSQVRQFGGFAPGKRVFGWTPKKCRYVRLVIHILRILLTRQRHQPKNSWVSWVNP